MNGLFGCLMKWVSPRFKGAFPVVALQLLGLSLVVTSR